MEELIFTSSTFDSIMYGLFSLNKIGIGKFLSYLGNDFNYQCHVNVEELIFTSSSFDSIM